MRGRKYNSRSIEQRHRRCLLAGLLVASGQVALADSPVATAPLPLVIASGQKVGRMQANPFCQPIPAAPGDLEELEELGAHAMGVPEDLTRKQSRWAGTAEIRRAHPGSIIPLTPGEPLWGKNFVMQSSGREYGAAPVDPAEQGEFRSLIQESVQVVSGGVRSNLLAGPVPMPVSDVQGVKPLVIAAERPPRASGPVSFSFSDENTAPIDTTSVSPHNDFSAVVRESSRTELTEAPARPQPRVRTPWAGANGHTASQPSGPSPTLARPSSAGRTLLVPIDEGSHVATVGQVRLPQPKSKHPDEARLVNGSRPKVEVGRPPLAIERGGKLSLTVEPAPKPLNKPAQTQAEQAVDETVQLPEPAPVTRLRFKPTEVRALKIENTIQRIEIKSIAVCAAVKTGPNQVQLIATGNGLTQLSLWTVDANGEEQRELYEIHVAEVQATQPDGLGTIAATLTQSVNNAFPNSKVLIHYHSGRLTATGTCEDEESARRILRMIRSACQMPVDDKVLVR